MRRASIKVPARWDIFCRVVDNLGDIAVCWRLARQLVHDHGLRVRLWVDRPAAFFQLCPAARRTLGVIDGVEVCRWDETFTARVVADVVIEAFSCDPPPAYVQAMATASPAPLWINLEYLSAESWVSDCHRMTSPHPRLPLVKHFFFPGFTSRSGGLLREPDLLRARDDFQATPGATAALLGALGVKELPDDALTVSLFAYERPGLPALMRCWADGSRDVLLLVPEGPVLGDVARFFDTASLPAGTRRCNGRLTAVVVPFTSQSQYDRLLWSCDLNFVRGEDSFVRAQWAARPFVWQIYAQHASAHLVKLEAFMEQFAVGLGGGPAAALQNFWRAWNARSDCAVDALVSHWPPFQAALPALRNHARQWADKLSMQDDLATALVKFCELSVK